MPCSTAASSPLLSTLYRTLGALVEGDKDRQKPIWPPGPRPRCAPSRRRSPRFRPSAGLRVLDARGPKGLETALGGSINVETIDFLGARNVAGGTPGGLAVVSIEQVLAWNSDVIVTIDRDFADNVRSDPLWASITAVRAGRVHLSPKMPFGRVDSRRR